MEGPEPCPVALHVIVHAWPQDVVQSERLLLLDEWRQVWRVASEALSRPLSVTFEQAAHRLAQLPRMFIEPDGSFVWVSEDGAGDWQIDGQLNDSPAGLMTLELKLSGPRADWPAVLRSVDWPRERLIYQLVHQGIYLDDREFRAVSQGAHR